MYLGTIADASPDIPTTTEVKTLILNLISTVPSTPMASSLKCSCVSVSPGSTSK